MRGLPCRQINTVKDCEQCCYLCGFADSLFVQGTQANIRRPPFMTHEVTLNRADVVLNVEFGPTDLESDNFVVLVAFNKIPTYKNYSKGVYIKDGSEQLEWNSKGGTYHRTKSSVI